MPHYTSMIWRGKQKKKKEKRSYLSLCVFYSIDEICKRKEELLGEERVLQLSRVTSCFLQSETYMLPKKFKRK